MSLPQVEEALAACDRRDAMLAMQMMNVIHASVAPVMVGEKAKPVFDKMFRALKRVIFPPNEDEQYADTMFGRLWAKVPREEKIKKGWDPDAPRPVPLKKAG